jgi:hypothetical protein
MSWARRRNNRGDSPIGPRGPHDELDPHAAPGDFTHGDARHLMKALTQVLAGKGIPGANEEALTLQLDPGSLAKPGGIGTR